LLEKNFYIFPIKDAQIYVQSGGQYGQGEMYYTSENPTYGATFTYYMKEAPKTDKSKRKDVEKKLFEEGKPIPQLTDKQLQDESDQEKSYLVFTIKDPSGNPIRKITSSASKGINKVNWDLRHPSPFRVRGESFDPTVTSRGRGIMVAPGKYTVHVAIYENGEYKDLSASKEFNVVPITNGSSLPGNAKEIEDYQLKMIDLIQSADACIGLIEDLDKKTIRIKQTLLATPKAGPDLMTKVQNIEKSIKELQFAFNGVEAKASYEELPPHDMPIYVRLENSIYAQYGSTSAITETVKQQFDIVKELIPAQIEKIKAVTAELEQIEKQLDELGAPWTDGRFPQLK